MRLLSFLAGLAGLFVAGGLAAQTPAAAPVPTAPPPVEAENVWNLDLSTGIKEEFDEFISVILLLLSLLVEVSSEHRKCLPVKVGGDGKVLHHRAKFVA